MFQIPLEEIEALFNDRKQQRAIIGKFWNLQMFCPHDIIRLEKKKQFW